MDQVLRKTTQLLLSVSVFSFFFSYSSLPSFLLHSFNFYFSKFPFQLFSHTTDRNCMFLLCNGILVFLVIYSCLINPPSGSDYSDEFFKKNGDDSPLGSLILETKASFLDKEVVVESTGSLEIVVWEEGKENEYLIEGGEGETKKSIVEHEERKIESGLLLITEREEEEEEEIVTENEMEEKEPESGFFIEEEEDDYDGEEEDDELLSIEELNKKFDDFIRRVKEGIRIENQQQLVMVKY